MESFGKNDSSRNKQQSNTKRNPSKEQLINQAINFHLEGNIQEASKYYQYCLDQDFNDQRVFSNYGAILKNHGKLKEAELSQRKAIEIKPDYADAHLNLGNILKDLGKLKEAELSQRQAIKLKPDYAEAHSNLGNILSTLGEIDEAVLNYERSLSIKPNMPGALVGLGKSLLIKGQYVKGLHLIKKGEGTISFDLERGVSITQ